MEHPPTLPPALMASPASTLDPTQNMFQLLLKERIVFLGSEVNDQVANYLTAQMLYLEGEDPDKDIWLYINSPGGSVTAGMAIYDTMQFIQPDVATICMGLGASMGQFLLCAGAAGKRFSLPHARIMMHQPLGGIQGQASDIAIQAEQMIYTKRLMAEKIAEHTGQTVEQIEQDSERDRWFTAEQAQDYGLIDHVIRQAGRDRSEPTGRQAGWSAVGSVRPQVVCTYWHERRARPVSTGRDLSLLAPHRRGEGLVGIAASPERGRQPVGVGRDHARPGLDLGRCHLGGAVELRDGSRDLGGVARGQDGSGPSTRPSGRRSVLADRVVAWWRVTSTTAGHDQHRRPPRRWRRAAADGAGMLHPSRWCRLRRVPQPLLSTPAATTA